MSGTCSRKVSAYGLALAGMCAFPLESASGQCGFTLIPLASGPNNEMHASAAWDPDGSGPQQPVLIVGGAFTSAGGVAARRVAIFNPTTGVWTAMGNPTGTGAGGAGVNNTVLKLLVRPMVVGADELYAAGEFTGTGTSTSGLSRVAKWVPSAPGATTGTWQPLGSGLGGTVRTLAFDASGGLVAGGDFLNSGLTACARVASWDGTAWNAMGPGLPRPVHALTLLDDGRLLAGLNLQETFEGIGVINVFAWNPAAGGGTGAWAGLGTDPAPRYLYGTVRAFAQAEGMGTGDRPLLAAGNLKDGGFEYGSGTALTGEVAGVGGVWSQVGPWEWADAFTASAGSVLPRPDRPMPDVLVPLRRVRTTVPSTFTLTSWRGETGDAALVELVNHPADGLAWTMSRVTASGASTPGPIFLGGMFVIPPAPPPAPPFPLGTVYLARYIDGCCPADLGGPGGTAGADGLLNNNDFVVFIDAFFAMNPTADIGSQGGVPGPDGAWDNNDFVVFIDRFFTGCL